jgi:serine/threonine-protein kinase RsbW
MLAIRLGGACSSRRKPSCGASYERGLILAVTRESFSRNRVTLRAELTNRSYRATYPSEIRNVAPARRGIADFAAACGFSEAAISDIRLAAGEALSNAVEHALGAPARRIAVICSFDDRSLTIEIRDRGSGFPAPAHLPQSVPDQRGRGFGIFLMRRLMDDVSFARKGTVVRLVRRLS